VKVETVSIESFRRFTKHSISLRNKTLEEATDRFLILGDNGSGKTTVLQAVALPLGLATRAISDIARFDWTGFVAGRYARWGSPRIELVVTFTDEEIAATREVSRRWYESLPHDRRPGPYVEPGDHREVRLVLEGDNLKFRSRAASLQFMGRFYARQLLKTDGSVRDEFVRLPGVFWFDEFRNLVRDGTPERSEEGDGQEIGGAVATETGIARLRRYLIGWMLARQSSKPYRNDYLAQIERLYQLVFPGRSFDSVEPMPGIERWTDEDFYFLLSDGQRTYDIDEMSGGERTVFPLLYDFVRLGIGHSVVLIDEIDLNLHPPAAQLLVSSLSRIGPTCQFIYTSHSEAVADIVGNDETERLPGGALCL